MLFRIKENEILLLIEQFLKSQQLLGALRSLEKESNVVLGNLDEVRLSYSFLQKNICFKVSPWYWNFRIPDLKPQILICGMFKFALPHVFTKL